MIGIPSRIGKASFADFEINSDLSVESISGPPVIGHTKAVKSDALV